jgi:uncharacterized membrane protein YhaH (DUF805 family)
MWRALRSRVGPIVDRTFRVVVVALLLALGATVLANAGQYEDAADAMRRGDYASASQLLLPLANQGDTRAQVLLGQIQAARTGRGFSSATNNSSSTGSFLASILLLLVAGLVAGICIVVAKGARKQQATAPIAVRDIEASASGSLFGRNPRLNRKQFWIWIGGLFAAKIAVFSVLTVAPTSQPISYIDTLIALFIAMAIGARFKDIGWPPALGIVLTFLIMVVLPLALLFATAPKDPIALQYVGWATTACLFALVVVAGTRPSRIAAPTESGVHAQAHTS